MDRQKIIEKAYQRGHLLNLKNTMYRSWIEQFIIEEVKGDIGSKGDITSNAVIRSKDNVKAVVQARERCILAGLEEAAFIYKKNNIQAVQFKKDGDIVNKGDKILELKGSEKDLLKIERSALDLLQRMSGIATSTKEVIDITKNNVYIAPTRKTQWRYLDKKAVFIGGGLTHRLALWDSILIKDNHLKALRREGIDNPIETSLKRAWKKKDSANFIEIEVEKIEDAVKASLTFKRLKRKKGLPCLIMLDNMDSKSIKSTIKTLKSLGLYEHVIIEASGGITPSNIKKYAQSGVDVISMGYLTHSAKAIDIKQHIL